MRLVDLRKIMNSLSVEMNAFFKTNVETPITKSEIENLNAQQPKLDSFNTQYLNLNYPGLTPVHLQRVYGLIIKNV